MSCQFPPYSTPNSVQGKLCRVLRPHHILGSIRFLGRGKKTFRKPLDPHHEEELPEFGAKSMPDRLVFMWGVADHGGLGRALFVSPDHSKGQHHLSFVHHKYRLEFGEYPDVVVQERDHEVTHSKGQTLIPSTLFGCNEITPEAKVTIAGQVLKVSCGVNHTAALVKEIV
ncbi:hypothetical protein Pmani_037178 [Petrolisthes manimaculis]|uniref:Uncharacterized protein n=1 Tax=Petrolisthes manimaculis TaxID=1843537 RepID=A0AAE1TLR5_9EUCA|nr:hypothetical protein Pmani_037178 [Petrolisthes manimaculis]